MPMSSSTLTIRLPQQQRVALKRAATALRMTESAYVRDLLARELDEIPFGERMGDLAGAIDSRETPTGHNDTFRDTIGRNNRRPA